jgi:hypothetical protein
MRKIVAHHTPGGVAAIERPHQQPLDDEAEQQSDDQREGQREPRRDAGHERQQRIGIGADHVELAMGEVHDLQDAEDQR